eukprot:Platyproteum_vivax@DN7389_c1_g3_i2.p1
MNPKIGMLLVFLSLINLVTALRISSLSQLHLKSVRHSNSSKAEKAKVIREATAVLKTTLELLDQVGALEKQYGNTVVTQEPLISVLKKEYGDSVLGSESIQSRSLEMKTQLEKLETDLKKIEVKIYQMAGKLSEKKKLVEEMLLFEEHAKLIREVTQLNYVTIVAADCIEETAEQLVHLDKTFKLMEKREELKEKGQLPKKSEENEEVPTSCEFQVMLDKLVEKRNAQLAEYQRRMVIFRRATNVAPKYFGDAFYHRRELTQALKDDLTDYGSYENFFEALQSSEKSNNDALESITNQKPGVAKRIQLIEKMSELDILEQKQYGKENLGHDNAYVNGAFSGEGYEETARLLRSEIEELKKQVQYEDEAAEKQQRECMQKELTKKLRELGDDEETYTKLLKEVA